MDYDELAIEFIRNMRAVGTAKRKRFIQEGIHGEAVILNFIKDRDGVVPGQISEALGITSARVAAALNSLEDKGLVTREIDSADRRRIIVNLTSKGRKLAEEQWKRHMEQIRDVLMMLGEQDAKEYVRILGKLAEILSDKGP